LTKVSNVNNEVDLNKFSMQFNAAIFEYCVHSKLLFQEKEERLQQCLMKLQAAEASSEC